MTTTLIEALRADTRAKLAVIHTLHELERALAILTEAIDLMRTVPEDRPDRPVADDAGNRLAADLTMVEAARADLAARLDSHGRVLEAGLFGIHVSSVATS